MQTEIKHSSFRLTSGYTPRSTNWISIRLLNVYRLGLSTLFISQAFIEDSPLLNIVNLKLFSWVSSAFLMLAMIWMLAAWIERRGFHHQMSLQIYTDTVIIILLMHACGGISSGIGMLLIISIAVAGLLAEQTLSIIFASLASLGLLAEHIYSAINISGYSGTSTQVGILGATLFATALVTHLLTLRIRSSELLVQEREYDVALLSALNQEIIENLQAGVVVLGRNYFIRHINQAAMDMLGIEPDRTVSLKMDAPELLQALATWQQNPTRESPFLPSETGMENTQISFRSLKSPGQENTLIFLNDVSSIRNSMQQAKLASLGHLTASIAHEIRNPLGAISYAAQLLSENEELAETDHRMTEIIHQHTQRINHIIEDILQISRGSPTAMEPVDLHLWLEKFVSEFCLSNQAGKDCFELDIESGQVHILFDPNHLNRVMTNLCTNAIDHGVSNRPVHIKVFFDHNLKLTIEIADEGPGIKQENLDQIFEPFFTTSHKGSGLGLYIVNQLCELNNAAISVHKNLYNGTSFIILPSIYKPNLT
ncbi:MAG: ATP-binding protein [Gammaproteobacteria bacterium]|nr:ATP-binding protein [Gammaproteobacteria bacterium]